MAVLRAAAAAGKATAMAAVVLATAVVTVVLAALAVVVDSSAGQLAAFVMAAAPGRVASWRTWQ